MAITLYDYTPAPSPRRARILLAEKGLVANWNAKIEFEGLMAAAEALRNSSPGMVDRATTGPVNYAQIPELAARGKERLGHFMDMLNERLEGRSYIATDQFTVADITALVVVDFAKWVKVVPGDEHANLKRWHAEVSARPSAKA